MDMARMIAAIKATKTGSTVTFRVSSQQDGTNLGKQLLDASYRAGIKLSYLSCPDPIHRPPYIRVWHYKD